jgi:Fe-S oxidoreductase
MKNIISKLLDLGSGRSVEEQIEYLDRYGNHGTPQLLRKKVLHNLGLPPAKETAEYMVVFGCYVPFSYGSLISDYFQVLDHIGINYTYLEDELCCGLPVISRSSESEIERSIKVGKTLMNANIEEQQKRGVKGNILLCCGCAHCYKAFSPHREIEHLYALDVLSRFSSGLQLKAPFQTTVGYFEGCHSHYKRSFPGTCLDWEDYRPILERVQGLKVVDLPNNLCCRTGSDKILQSATERGLDLIVSPCNGCCYRLSLESYSSNIRIEHIITLLRKSLPSVVC